MHWIWIHWTLSFTSLSYVTCFFITQYLTVFFPWNYKLCEFIIITQILKSVRYSCFFFFLINPLLSFFFLINFWYPRICNPFLLSPMHVFVRDTWYVPKETRGEHANSTQKGPLANPAFLWVWAPTTQSVGHATSAHSFPRRESNQHHLHHRVSLNLKFN